MMSNDPSWLASFPALRDITDPAWRRTVKAARVMTIEAGKVVFRENGACVNFLLIMDGSVRVQRLAANGQVITLYHLGAGQACELTTICLLGGKCYPAEGVAETRVQAVVIPAALFRETLAYSPAFSQFVFSSVDKGMNELILLLEEVAFGHVDRRLAHCLVHMSQSRDYLDITHQDLAEELGTAREVVSRVLKEFERQGWVRLQRGHIELCDRHRLEAIAQKSVV